MAVVDLDDAAPEEISNAIRRFEKQDAGIVKAEGDSASARARAISSKWLPVLTHGALSAP